MYPSSAQAFIAARLAAATALAGIPRLIELPDTATAEEIAAYESDFETAIKNSGMVLVVLQREIGGGSSTPSRLSCDVMIPIAVCESPEVNRAAAGPRREPRLIVDHVVAAVLCDQVTMDRNPVVNAGEVEQGLYATYVRPIVKCTISASGVITPPFVPPPV